ncbi:hydrolase [Streptomyces sp. NPDC005374]|uniref:Vgb family protein n=1 Tax=Streptomyces sp. NPDC005374 TaxID=3364713 RepID=UPI0036CB121A
MIFLPGNASPSDMVLTDDGTLWVAQAQLSAIAEIDPSGKVTQHPLPRGPGYPPYPYDLQESPDGGIWYSASDQLGRLDPSGKFTWWDDSSSSNDNGPGSDDGPGYPDGLTLSPDNTIWFAHIANGGIPAFSRADNNRGLSSIAILKGKGTFSIPTGGIVAGPDRAVWFSQIHQYDESDGDGIGRLTVQGAYKEWPLPKGTTPQRIVAGPDKALWFTERGGIGRIDVDGDVSHFAVRESEHPDGIALGPDEALWFTTDSRVGRITPRGKITLWPVRGAKGLSSIVPIPDGGFWLTDRGTDTVRRFSPPR